MSKPTRFAHWKWLRVDPKWQQIRRAEEKHMGWVKEAAKEQEAVDIAVIYEVSIEKFNNFNCGANCQYLSGGNGSYSCTLFEKLLENSPTEIKRASECFNAENRWRK